MDNGLEPSPSLRSSAATPSWSLTHGASVAETDSDVLLELLRVRQRHGALRAVSFGAISFLALFVWRLFQSDVGTMLLAFGLPVGIAMGLEWMGRRALRQRGRELGVREEVVAELVERTGRAPWRDPVTVLAELRATERVSPAARSP